MAKADYAIAIRDSEPQYVKIVGQDGLPLNFEKEAHFAIQIVSASEELQRCAPSTIRDSVVNAASVGLSLNPAQKHAYLIPWKGRCSLFVSYMGMEYMALAAEVIQWVRADEVFTEDAFSLYHDETGFHYRHEPKYGKRGVLVGAYAVWKYANGDVDGMFMDAAELAEVRKASKAPHSPAWSKWSGQMHCKAVIKRAAKHWRKTPLLARQIEKVHELDKDGYGKTDAGVITGEAVEVISIEQEEALHGAIPDRGLLDKLLVAYNIKNIGDLPAKYFNEVLDRIIVYKEAKAKAKAKPR